MSQEKGRAADSLGRLKTAVLAADFVPRPGSEKFAQRAVLKSVLEQKNPGI
jgi:hypothetical protein